EFRARHAEAFELAGVEAADDRLLTYFTDPGRLTSRIHRFHIAHRTSFFARLHWEADVLSNPNLPAAGSRFPPWHFNKPAENRGLWRDQTQKSSCPFDLTEFTTDADYIHSANLVNMRYSRQLNSYEASRCGSLTYSIRTAISEGVIP